jgi:hypothetical protein
MFLDIANYVKKEAGKGLSETNVTAAMVEQWDNGTTIKWKTYKALLSQSGEDAPVARVLNQDEADYLGDINWIRNGAGVYTAINDNLLLSMTLANIISTCDDVISTGELKNVLVEYGSGSLTLCSSGSDGLADGLFANTPIEIKVRQRGASPVLLSAETNNTGDKIILTFDKKMSNYGLLNSIESGDFDFDVQSADNYTLVDNIITLNVPTPFQASDTINFRFYGNNNVESFDYGLLQPFADYIPVTNNVSEYLNPNGDLFNGNSEHDIAIVSSYIQANGHLRAANLFQANLTGMDLSGIDLSGANITSTICYTCNMSNANFTGVVGNLPYFRNTNLGGAIFHAANISNANFSHTDINGVDFSSSSLLNCNFYASVFIGGTSLMNTVLTGSNISGPNIFGINTIVDGADLTGTFDELNTSINVKLTYVSKLGNPSVIWRDGLVYHWNGTGWVL